MYLLEFLHYAAILFTVFFLERPESLPVGSITQHAVIFSVWFYLQFLGLKGELFIGNDWLRVDGAGVRMSSLAACFRNGVFRSNCWLLGLGFVSNANRLRCLSSWHR